MKCFETGILVATLVAVYIVLYNVKQTRQMVEEIRQHEIVEDRT